MQRRINFKTNYLIVFIIFVMLIGKSTKSQEMLGVTLGNYSGVTSVMVNPAMIANTRYYLDINLVSADVFFRNNFAYIPASDASIYSIIRDRDNLPTYGSDDINFTHYINNDFKSTVIRTKVLGPSAMIQLGNHSFALSTSAQFFTSANRIPYEIPLFGYYGVGYDPLHNINFIDYDIDAVTAAWMDVGISYAYTAYEYLDQKITVGATLKYIWSYAGMYMESSNVDYIVLNDSTLNIKNLNGSTGFASPIDYSDSDQAINDPLFKGRGFGVDLGVVYVKKKRVDKERWHKLCGQEFDDYIFRLGVSILDLGNMTYKNNAQLHRYKNDSAYILNYNDLSFTNVNQFFHDIDSIFGKTTTSLEESKIKIGLPTAVSIQADYNIYKNFYASGFWIHPLRFNHHTIRRPAQVAIVPRYESKYFEVNLPVSVYEYKYPRVGLSVRFWFFTIGTERLGTWLGIANLDGLDIYASIKFGFGKGDCRVKFKNACVDDNYRKKKKSRNKLNKNFVF